MIRINYDRNSFSEAFNRALSQGQDQTGMLMVAGRELGNQLKKHFRRKDAEEPNKLSPRRQHFWLRISRGVQNPKLEGPKTVSVAINDPAIAQKVFGGTITAKKAGALTIPVSEQAYGRTAATFEAETGLKLFLMRKDGKAVLAAHIGSSTSTGEGKIEIEYVLKRSVTQRPDPTALPEEKELEAAILGRAQKFVDREKAN